MQRAQDYKYWDWKDRVEWFFSRFMEAGWEVNWPVTDVDWRTLYRKHSYAYQAANSRVLSRGTDENRD